MPLEVHVVTPEREVWSGEASMVIARGVEGEVGILGGHAPLLVQLVIGPLRMLQPDGSWLRAVVDGGFLHVSSQGGATRADVLVAHAELEHEIDLAAERRRLEEWEGRAQEDVDGVAKAEIAKSLARVKLLG
jgi:F-type H+-transporting ATPase subunit epsilon